MNKARRGGGETNEIFRRVISKLNTNNIVIFTFCYNNIIVDCPLFMRWRRDKQSEAAAR